VTLREGDQISRFDGNDLYGLIERIRHEDPTGTLEDEAIFVHILVDVPRMDAARINVKVHDRHGGVLVALN
jgi:hypothetical protein